MPLNTTTQRNGAFGSSIPVALLLALVGQSSCAFEALDPDAAVEGDSLTQEAGSIGGADGSSRETLAASDASAPTDAGVSGEDQRVLDANRDETSVAADTGADAPAKDAPVDLPADLPAMPDSRPRAAGEPCTLGPQCSSGFCVDGFCCNEACGGACQACDLSGALGRCTLVPSGQPHNKPMCGGSGECRGGCNGTSAGCAFPAATTACGSASCSGANLVKRGSCDGAGACKAGATESCGGYACVVDHCLTACDGQSECAAQYRCDTSRRVCVSESCNASGDCLAGEYCAKSTGACSATGVCSPKPQTCPPIVQEVCGCNGTSYANACLASQAGYSLSKTGVCN